MAFILHPWQLLLVILAGWINQQQQQIIEFQRLGGLLRYYPQSGRTTIAAQEPSHAPARATPSTTEPKPRRVRRSRSTARLPRR